MRCLLVFLAVSAWGQSRESIEKQLKSVAQQREAIRRTHAADPPLSPADIEPPSCEPLPENEVSPMIETAAKHQQLPPKLLRAVIAQESGFRACAVSKKGAKGLMQLMPATAEDLDIADPFDPETNLEAGAKFLRQLLEKYKGDLPQSLAAYNAGPATVDVAHGIPDIQETRDYVDAIVGKMGVKQIDLPNIPMPKPIGN
jgi:soluble lytic murein transglycosylase-like protein